jgi:hypothetical protein
MAEIAFFGNFEKFALKVAHDLHQFRHNKMLWNTMAIICWDLTNPASPPGYHTSCSTAHALQQDPRQYREMPFP